jgi:hypothetical protein
MEYVNGLEEMRGYYTIQNDPPLKKQRLINSKTTITPSAFNPPSVEQRLAAPPTSVYNERQMQAMQQRLATQQQEQQDAFQRLPAARTSLGNTSESNGLKYAGGVQERQINGTKRAHDGVTIKRER